MSVSIGLQSECPVTIREILEAVPVSSRSIRSWIRQGLLPKPIKYGLGRAVGTMALYPPSALRKAVLIYRIRNAGKKDNLMKLVGQIGSSKIYLGIDDDGLPTMKYVPKSFQED
uniref:Uncharacterized protein n=1 Tax=viral metagenome TaxID=1070528 RepID=A0A6H1ZTW7_9ZZZZ